MVHRHELRGDEAYERLDSAIREGIGPRLGPDEIPVAWIVVVATRRADGGGAIDITLSDDGMPTWQANGMLLEARDMVRDFARNGDEDEDADT